jgi:hypothetical protein
MTDRHYILSSLAGAALLVTMCLARAAPLPPAAMAALPPVKQIGEGKLTFFGLHVYDASLWVTGERFDWAQPFALELTYRMGLSGKAIAERSIKEMRGQGYSEEAKLARWQTVMEKAFPDIKPGDQLAGICRVEGGKPVEVRFFHNGKATGGAADGEFARAFFEIWLAEKTSEPKLRDRLLGKRD